MSRRIVGAVAAALGLTSPSPAAPSDSQTEPERPTDAFSGRPSRVPECPDKAIVFRYLGEETAERLSAEDMRRAARAIVAALRQQGE